MNEEKPLELNIPGIDPNTISLNGELYFKGQKVHQLPKSFGENQNLSGLEGKLKEELDMWKELDNLFDSHANDQGINFNAYQEAVEYLRNKVDAEFVRLTFLGKTSGTANIPKEFRHLIDSNNEFFKVKFGSEEVYEQLRNENKLFSIVRDKPTEEIVPDDMVQNGKHNAFFSLKLKEELEPAAMLEIYGINNDAKTKLIIETFNNIVDTKVHRELTTINKIGEVITRYEEQRADNIAALEDLASKVAGRRVTLADAKAEQEIVTVGGVTDNIKARADPRDKEPGSYYTANSFYGKNARLINEMLRGGQGSIKDTALNGLELPNLDFYYNRKKSMDFISEEELTDKLAKLIIATTLAKTASGVLTKNLSQDELSSFLRENKKIYDLVAGNGIVGLYSLFSKRAKEKTRSGEYKLVFPELENVFDNLRIFTALNRLWFDSPIVHSNDNHFVYRGNNIYVIDKLTRGERKIDDQFVPLVNNVRDILPYINDKPHKKENNKPNNAEALGDLIEACTIFMNYGQRTPYYLEGYEEEGLKPHTIRDSLIFVGNLGYKSEANLIANTVYNQHPLKPK